MGRVWGPEEIARRFKEIRERVAEAALRVGRRPEEIRILGAAKGQNPEKIRAAAEAGLRLVGENYVQEAERKRPLLEDLPLSWHLIGYLQRNKARKALKVFDLIETVDRTEIAERLSRLALEEGRRFPVFIQVKLAPEERKAGAPPEEVPALARRVLELPGLEPRGLMTIPPYFEDPEEVRPYFRRLREMRDHLWETLKLPGPGELSMGMSHDFEVAIEEGATLVRLGRALFGPRPPKA
ncbi:YggS family pyridoxal phosphate-dependent enzyme [Thermosulfurimonas marina]|uniref:Pyridoxal phosphate homeostasis protein n=1 Tax=Thermosulfurimonas marina TaxID=2047767 RepID=A0A6H1WUH9_9BACT|nr:YggS family pyridoxal phosphate-dependent enzyme [Thermosulfurimonas marina]QJA06875.1 YggS family pyridoxal phosphate-dependent enzyme [Thermosulfurimonas marina]